MCFLNNKLIFLSLIFSSSLILSATALRIVDCKTNWTTMILSRDPQDTLRYNGRIDAELAWNKTYGVALVKNLTFSGITIYMSDPMKKIVVDLSSLKAVRVQRFVEYARKDFKDIVVPQCNLGFLYDDNVSLNLSAAFEYGIISHAEKCIEDQICNFDPESHRIGDDIHVKSKSRHQKNQTTSQGPINAATDFIVNTLINDLIKANKSLLAIPAFNVSVFPVAFSSSGGLVDILKYIQRADDLSFYHEGRKYAIDSLVTLTGGHTQLNNVSVTSTLGNFVNGELPVNMTGATLRMKVAFDYNQAPCKITVPEATVNVSSDQVDFSTLKITFLGFDITNVDTILRTLLVKSLVVNEITNQVAGLLTELVEGLECEDYRDLVFKLEGKN